MVSERPAGGAVEPGSGSAAVAVDAVSGRYNRARGYSRESRQGLFSSTIVTAILPVFAGIRYRPDRRDPGAIASRAGRRADLSRLANRDVRGGGSPAARRPTLAACPQARSRRRQAAVTETTRTLTVAVVARRLGVAPATLRTWARRYDLGPSLHTAGSHRRYTPEDFARLVVMRRLTHEGVAPAEAAQVALQHAGGLARRGRPGRDRAAGPARPRRRRPAAADLSRRSAGWCRCRTPAGSRAGLNRAALTMDARGVAQLLQRQIAVAGVVSTWEDVMVPGPAEHRPALGDHRRGRRGRASLRRGGHRQPQRRHRPAGPAAQHRAGAAQLRRGGAAQPAAARRGRRPGRAGRLQPPARGAGADRRARGRRPPYRPGRDLVYASHAGARARPSSWCCGGPGPNAQLMLGGPGWGTPDPAAVRRAGRLARRRRSGGSATSSPPEAKAGD